MASRRALLITNRFAPFIQGGAEVIAHRHARLLVQNGFEVGVYTGYEKGEPHPVEPPETHGLRVFRPYQLNTLSSGKLKRKAEVAAMVIRSYLSGAHRVRLDQVVREFKPDLIHAHDLGEIPYDVFSRFGEIPSFVTFHTYRYECPRGLLLKGNQQLCESKPLPCRGHTAMTRARLRSVRGIIGISTFIYRRLLELGFDRSRVHYIPNPVPPPPDEPLSESIYHRRLLFIGRISREKGLFHLVDAVRRLTDSDLHLDIVGDGPQMDMLRSYVQGESRIHIHGWKPQAYVHRLYEPRPIVVVPSLWHELMNTVITEAQAAGCPVIASDVGGNRDMITDGESGLLYPVGDTAILSEKIRSLVGCPRLGAELGERGRSAVRRFDPAQHWAKLEQIYAPHLGA